jgi:hypothetical protein
MFSKEANPVNGHRANPLISEQVMIIKSVAVYKPGYLADGH